MVSNESEILHQEFFALQKKDLAKAKSTLKNGGDDMLKLTFFIPY